MGTDPDPLVEELVRARRDRLVLAYFIAVGIVASVVLGVGSSLGALGGEDVRNHGALAYFVVPLAASIAFGYAATGSLRAVHSARRRRSPDRSRKSHP